MALADFYSACALSPDDTNAAVRASYRDFVRMLDHGVGLWPRRRTEIRRTAFSALADPAWRRSYDEELRRASLPQPLAAPHLASSHDLFGPGVTVLPSGEALRERLLRNFTQIGVPKSEHAESLTVEVGIAAEDQLRQQAVAIEFPTFEPCAACAGTGHIDLFPCADCGGEGFLEASAIIEEETAGRAVVERSLAPLGIGNLYLRILFVAH